VYELSIRGDLSLRGVSREVELPVRVEIHADALRAVGSLRLRQSDYRIRPTSAAGGTIKVDDDVRLEFDVTARVE
jgi:polyisoprenoid-binding protein YceI